MKAITNSVLDKIIAPIMVASVILIVTSIGPKASAGDWLEWFVTIPKPIWVTVVTLLVLWILASVIYRRIGYLPGTTY